jgi:hypothetical protein
VVKLKDLLNEVLSEGTCGYGINGKLGTSPAGPNLYREADVFGNTSPTTDVDKAGDTLEKEMGDSLKDLEAALKSDVADAKAEVDQIDESQLNEALGTTAIIGLILAAPKVVEMFAKGISGLFKMVKKLLGKEPNESKIATAIIDFTHKWHKGYINIVFYILKYTGIFRKAKITNESQQMKVANAVYYIIIAGLAVQAGIGAVSAFEKGMSAAAQGSEFKLAALETAMSAIKSGEVTGFLRKLGLGA